MPVPLVIINWDFQTPPLHAAKQTRIPRNINLHIQLILLLVRRDHLLKRLHAVKRGAEAFPHLARSGLSRQEGCGGFAIPDSGEGVWGALHGGESESILGFVLKVAVCA